MNKIAIDTLDLGYKNNTDMDSGKNVRFTK